MGENIIITLLSVLFGLVQGLAFFIISRLYKKVDVLEEDMKAIRSNYLAQFAKVNESLNDIKIVLARLDERMGDFEDKFGELKAMLIKHDNSINALKFSHAKQHGEQV